jgi:hypothetical protein
MDTHADADGHMIQDLPGPGYYPVGQILITLEKGQEMSTVDHRWRHGPSYLISLHNYMRAQAHRKHVMDRRPHVTVSPAAKTTTAQRDSYVHGTVLRRPPHETTTLYVLRRIPFPSVTSCLGLSSPIHVSAGSHPAGVQLATTTV